LRQRACLQRHNKAFLIIRIQQRWPTRAWCTSQAALPARCQRLLPPAHRGSARVERRTGMRCGVRLISYRA
jgi:hypothetical protein